tara:strand:- start:598 stop:1422 length:825 start_codon:yes stop_codon:yes gene_type:complete
MQSFYFTQDIIFLIFLLVLSGVFTGFVSGLFGVGGGIIMVPALIHVFDELGYSNEFTTHLAIGTSLGIIVPTSLISAWSYHKRGSLKIILFSKLAFPVAGFSILGTILAGSLSGRALKLIFTIIIILIALNFLRDQKILRKELPELPQLWGVVGIIGFFSSMIGVGGGAFFISYFTAYSVPLLSALGTSASLGVMISLPGVIGYIANGWNLQNLPPFSFGYFSLLGFVFVVPTTMIMAPQGAKLAHYLDKKKLKRLFAIFLLIMSLTMLYKIFF